jgi:hypothetical protein
VTVSHGSIVNSTCPSITSLSTGIAAFNRWTGNASVTYTGKVSGGTHSVNITDYASFYQSTAWPGSQAGLVAQVVVPNDKYVSLEFKAPAGYLAGLSSTVVGQYIVGATAYSVPISLSISTTCGDFSNPTTYPSTSTVVPGCWKNVAPSNGGLVWHKTGTSCVLQDNKTYYLNFINADVSNVQPGGGTATSNRVGAKCPNGACSDPIQNGGNWPTD